VAALAYQRRHRITTESVGAATVAECRVRVHERDGDCTDSSQNRKTPWATPKQLVWLHVVRATLNKVTGAWIYGLENGEKRSWSGEKPSKTAQIFTSPCTIGQTKSGKSEENIGFVTSGGDQSEGPQKKTPRLKKTSVPKGGSESTFLAKGCK